MSYHRHGTSNSARNSAFRQRVLCTPDVEPSAHLPHLLAQTISVPGWEEKLHITPPPSLYFPDVAGRR